MSKGNFLLGAAGGFAAGYAVYRTYEAVTAHKRPASEPIRDAARYGVVRRSLALAGIARSLAGSALLAYGPLGTAMQRSAAKAPPWLRSAVFMLEGTILETILDSGTAYVEEFETERRFGLSDQCFASWLQDKVKQDAIGAALAVVLSMAFSAIVRRAPKAWPFIASAGVFPLLVAANIAVPLYILPLFNTYVPIEGPLEERLRKLAARYGVGDAQILRMDMSKQTNKANAFVTGIFRTHRIVIGDTLIERFPHEEVEFVVAHELGHYVARDSWRMIAAGQISAMILLFSVASLPARSIEKGDAVHLARLQFWAGVISQVLRPALCAFSRSREWAADRFALSATQTPQTGASAFRRLRDQNLAEDEQPAWYENLFAGHPSLKSRIGALEAALDKGVSSLAAGFEPV